MRAFSRGRRPAASFLGITVNKRRRGQRQGCSNVIAAAKLVAMHPVTATQPRGRVLTVDDSAVMRLLVTASLEALGYSVEAVDSGHAALAASQREDFDAVVLDVD